MTQDVKVPTLGESVTEATVGEWLKQPGDAVALDEPIASLETDKVAVEVPSPVAGVLSEHSVAVCLRWSRHVYPDVVHLHGRRG